MATTAKKKTAAAAPTTRKRISKNFVVEEFDCHDGTKVPAVAHVALKALAKEFLEPMRRKFGKCKVLSGYRHRAYNRSIGGALHSQHIYDDTPASVASDLRFERGTPAEWARFAREIVRQLGYGGVGEYRRSYFVHVDNRPYKAFWGPGTGGN